MDKISFFTPVDFNGVVHDPLFEKLSDLMSLSSKKASVISQNNMKLDVVINSEDVSKRKLILKIAFHVSLIAVSFFVSYLFLTVPVALLLVYAALRSRYSFQIIDVTEDLYKTDPLAEIDTLLKINNIYIQVSQGNYVGITELDGKTRFKHKDLPHFEFIDGEFSISEYLSKMVRAKRVCVIHGLSQFIFPKILFTYVQGKIKSTFVAIEHQKEASQVPSATVNLSTLIKFIVQTKMEKIDENTFTLLKDESVLIKDFKSCFPWRPTYFDALFDSNAAQKYRLDRLFPKPEVQGLLDLQKLYPYLANQIADGAKKMSIVLPSKPI